jgi:GNAT superfamily N-acetyltransferase
MNIVGEIRYNLGEDYARLKFSETRDSFSIDTVMVPAAHRGKGIGTFLINHVLTLADRMQKEVYLTARPMGNANEENINRLVRYYRKFDFFEYDRGVTASYMRRNRVKRQE